MLAGEVMFGTDSHTCNAGAFGQFASGIGNTDAGFILGTGKLLIKVPPSIRFVLDGEMPPYLLAKDIILQIIGEITVAGRGCFCPCLPQSSLMCTLSLLHICFGQCPSISEHQEFWLPGTPYTCAAASGFYKVQALRQVSL